MPHHPTANQPLYVNVASSRFVLEGFINLDTSAYYWLIKLPRFLQDKLPQKYQPDLAAYRDAKSRAVVKMRDCRRPLPYADNTVDHICCSHFLEHIYLDQCRRNLRDYYRALKPGGTLHVRVPDFRVYVNEYLENSKKGDVDAVGKFLRDAVLCKENAGSWRYRILEGSGFFGLQHRWMYDKASMEKEMKDAGFTLFEDHKGNATPSSYWGFGDDSVIVFGRKE